MVFVGGPRQVGKSTLRLSLIPGADGSHPAYLSWDAPEHKRLRVRGGLPAAMRPAGKSTFVVLRNGKPEFALERKTGERALSRNIIYYAQRTAIPASTRRT
jgi:hypothetical protein